MMSLGAAGVGKAKCLFGAAEPWAPLEETLPVLLPVLLNKTPWWPVPDADKVREDEGVMRWCTAAEAGGPTFRCRFTAVLSAPGARGGRPEEEEDEEDEDEDEEEEALLLAPTVTALLSAGVAMEAKLGRSVGMSMLSSMGTRTTVGSKK
jgi:hypothetical protein